MATMGCMIGSLDHSSARLMFKLPLQHTMSDLQLEILGPASKFAASSPHWRILNFRPLDSDVESRGPQHHPKGVGPQLP